MKANIPEQALIYKFTELATNKSFVYTGDTSFYPPIAKFVKSVPLLIHDVTHSSAKEAANIELCYYKVVLYETT